MLETFDNFWNVDQHQVGNGSGDEAFGEGYS